MERGSPCRPDRLWVCPVSQDQAQETGWGETGCKEAPAGSGVSLPRKQHRILLKKPRTTVEPEEAARAQTPSAETHLQTEKKKEDRNHCREKPDRASDLPPF